MLKLGGEQIRVGQPIPFDCYDGHGNLLLRKGLVIGSQKQVDFLLERGLYGIGGPATAVGDDAVEKPATPFQLLDDFTNRLKQLLAALGKLVDAPSEQASITNFPERVMNLAGELQALCLKDSDALLGAIHLAKGSRYSLDHPLYRAIVTELLATRKGLPQQERQRVVAAALTCDISMTKLQDELVRQAGPLSAEQKLSIASHPMESARLLESLGVTDKAWISAVAQHHEVLNGTGYPHRCAGEDVSLWSRVLKLAGDLSLFDKAFDNRLISERLRQQLFERHFAANRFVFRLPDVAQAAVREVVEQLITVGSARHPFAFG